MMNLASHLPRRLQTGLNLLFGSFIRPSQYQSCVSSTKNWACRKELHKVGATPLRKRAFLHQANSLPPQSTAMKPSSSRETTAYRRSLLRCLVSSMPILLLSWDAPLTAADSTQADQLKLALKGHEFHADVLLDELRATDKRVESRMQNLVNALKVVADSKDSKTKVARMKKETIDGLMKVIELYNVKRAQIQEQLVRPTSNLTLEQKQSVRKALDSRIEKRAAQIVELQQSMPTHEEYEKYKVIPGGVGWADSTIIKNEDWEQNRRVTLHSDEVRKKLVGDLQRSIARLNEQEQRLKKQVQIPPAAHSLLEGELKRNAELLATRQTQLDQVLSEPIATGRPIGKGEAGVLDDAVKVAVTGLKMEITKLFSDYTAFMTFLPQVNSLRAQAQPSNKP